MRENGLLLVRIIIFISSLFVSYDLLSKDNESGWLLNSNSMVINDVTGENKLSVVIGKYEERGIWQELYFLHIKEPCHIYGKKSIEIAIEDAYDYGKYYPVNSFLACDDSNKISQIIISYKDSHIISKLLSRDSHIRFYREFYHISPMASYDISDYRSTLEKMASVHPFMNDTEKNDFIKKLKSR